jgi:hypothetical protein
VKAFARSVALAVALFAAPIARANPRPLPFTYIHETLAEGESEVEQYADLVPTRVVSSDTGRFGWYGTTQFQTEYEHGLTDHLELGLYVTYVPTPSGFVQSPTLTEGTGFKERLRWRLADTGAWPVDVGLYGEVTENEHEIELEGKVILQRRVGAWRIVGNAWVEREMYFEGRKEWVLNPTLGVTFGGWPSVQPGIEWWMRAEFPDGGTSPGANHYVGPAVLVQLDRLWWTTGIYVRVNDFDETDAPGTGMSHLWIRSVIGVGL